MSSILTNNGAMVALQSLQSINKNLAATQNQISTGKDVSSARDNAAVWAISKVMEADVKGFNAISDSLGLGESTVSVARQASETVTDLLTQLKGKIVSAQEDNVDRAKIQTDVQALRDQIGSVVSAAQFNGLNLLSNTSTTAGEGSINVLSSLDRNASGVVASDITVGKQDLGTGAAATGTATGTATNRGTTNAATAGSTVDFATFTTAPAAGTIYTIASVGGTALTNAATYIAREGDTLTDVATEMASRATFQAQSQGLDVKLEADSGTAGRVTLTNNTANTITMVATNAADGQVMGAAGQIGGGLEYMSNIDVSTSAGANAALGLVEDLIQTSIDAAASFGSAQGRIDTQSDFVGKMMDALKSGIGTLVDANMEEASARLQALQVQQQLGVQSLSIANQAPQSILSLFR